MDFESLQAYFASIDTSATEILRILRFESAHDDESERTRMFLNQWIQTSIPEMLVKFLQCICGQMGVTSDDMILTVLSLI